MEDILASIRRILNEDEVPAPAATAPAAAPADGDSEPLALTEAMMVPAAMPATPPVAPPAALAAADAPPDAMPVAAAPDGPLLAPAAAAATAAALGALARAVSSERGAAVHRDGPSIEDVVREELRPLLKAWLDQHLPPLVERVVRAEIERAVGGRH